MYDSIIKSIIQGKGMAQASEDFRNILINKFDDMDEIRSRLDTLGRYKDMQDVQNSANQSYTRRGRYGDPYDY